VKIIRTVQCCIVYHNCTVISTHTYEQFLQVGPAGLGLDV